MAKNMKQKSVSSHDFSMVPRADVPRSSIPFRKAIKKTFDASYLIPILCEEVLPGDTWNINCTIVARTQTPIVPIMDNWHMETFFFFEPNRLVWQNWQRFMGEQDSPGDSISYTIPQVVSPSGGAAPDSLFDHFGIPGEGQIDAGDAVSVSALPFRAYQDIYNKWFRDQNLIGSQPFHTDDGPDPYADYGKHKRGKRHDYFASCLPFVQKGESISLPLGTEAPIRTSTTQQATGTQPALTWRNASGGTIPGGNFLLGFNAADTVATYSTSVGTGTITPGYPSNLIADLSTATAATINQLRQSFQVQRLLERDARGGTRYTELVRAHFGVISPDARLQRPEYLGGGHIPIITNAVPQTSATDVTGSTSPMGTLAATGHAQGRNGFTYAATEHGYIIGLVSVRADQTYQQGLRRHWSRLTRYDFYWPAFAMLGEQPVYNKEIYVTGTATDNDVFGYQERWAEYRYSPSEVHGYFRSYVPGTLDYWHSSQRFQTLPTLNSSFITDDTVNTITRNFAAGELTLTQQFLADIFYTGRVVRPMPQFSVPGMVDHL